MPKIKHHKDCRHTNKHHKRSGRCRGNCPCDYAAVKDEQKRRADHG